MKFRSVTTSVLMFSLLATTLVVLRAADDKTKGKEVDVPPPPGTIKFVTAPAAVQKTYKDETKNAKIELLGKGKMDEKDGDDKAFYKAIVGIGSNDYEFTVAANGQLLAKVLHPATAEISLEECPPGIQKSLKEEMKGAKVDSISKVTAGKRADFVINVIVQKTRYQVLFADDGTLLSKVLDDGPDDEQPESTAKEPEKSPAKEPDKKQPDKSVKKPK